MCSRRLSMRGACTTCTPTLLRSSTGQSLTESCTPRPRTPATHLPVFMLSVPLFLAVSRLYRRFNTKRQHKQIGQSPSSEPPTPEIQAADPPIPDVQVMDLPSLEVRVFDPPALPPTGLALLAHGRNATIDCPVVGTLAACLRERHGCRTVTWSARGVGNSEGTEGSHSENRMDYNVSFGLWTYLPIQAVGAEW